MTSIHADTRRSNRPVRSGWTRRASAVLVTAGLVAGCLGGNQTPAPVPSTPSPGQTASATAVATPPVPSASAPATVGPTAASSAAATLQPSAAPTTRPTPAATPTSTPGGAAYVPNCDEANLRTGPATSSPIGVTLGLKSVLTVNGTVPGSPWSVVCPGAKSGTTWSVISQIDGVAVSSRYGVPVLYAASGLFVPAGAPSLAVTHGRRTRNHVALTFDMGGRIGDALAIMNLLLSRQVGATIFMTGSIVDSTATAAGRDVLKLIEAHRAQFDLANHSYSHPYFTQLTAAQIGDELRRAETAFARHTSVDPRPFFRPPYGAYNAAALAGIGSARYRLSVNWDVDTIDWRPINNPGGPAGPTADQVISKVLTNAQAGSIVLMHLGGFETLKALPAIIDGLRGKGYLLVNLDTMLGP